MITEDHLDFVVNRVPEQIREIRQEYKRSESFRALCEDFRTCAEALERWKKSDAPAAPKRVVEYVQSLKELELEIGDWLQNPGK
jgi:hypothetical protein